MVPPFSKNIHWNKPILTPNEASYLYLAAALGVLFLKWRQRFLELFIVKYLYFPSLPGSEGDGGGKREWDMAHEPEWVAYR